MDRTFHRRPLPTNAVAFSSVEGREVFSEALASDGLNGYFPLAEQFHTQSDPAFCGQPDVCFETLERQGPLMGFRGSSAPRSRRS